MARQPAILWMLVTTTLWGLGAYAMYTYLSPFIAHATHLPTAGISAYAMSKGAVVALTTQLAVELRDEGITVNAIAPGLIDTPTNRRDMPDADFSRWTKPAEIARVIHALVSPGLGVTSGAIVPVHGLS